MPSGEKFILAIDLGTSGPKVALFSTQGELVGSEFEETRLILLPDGGAEQSPAEWWEAINKAARRLLAKGFALSENIVAIACTGQWSGTVPVVEARTPRNISTYLQVSRTGGLYRSMPDRLPGRLLRFDHLTLADR